MKLDPKTLEERVSNHLPRVNARPLMSEERICEYKYNEIVRSPLLNQVKSLVSNQFNICIGMLSLQLRYSLNEYVYVLFSLEILEPRIHCLCNVVTL